ncbi:MAG: hypothetical protein HFI67_02200 [Lachnospiraceae bacterium]|jgi:hypothetical protein|nr:hypothetical protein [Lachnospiraceae bacterium]
MDYEMEELVPLVGRLAKKYNGLESTSVTYEKAEQFMGAVLYCIREAGAAGGDTTVMAEGLSAEQAYEIGAACVREKVKAALALYHEILPVFSAYGNRCLEDTFLKGMPEFFKWYDAEFEPHNTILTLDYPVLKDLSGSLGIDRIYDFLECIRLEQEFLRQFSAEYIRRALEEYDIEYQEMIGNLCEIVLADAIKRLLPQKPFTEYLADSLGEIALRLKYAKIQKL